MGGETWAGETIAPAECLHKLEAGCFGDKRATVVTLGLWTSGTPLSPQHVDQFGRMARREGKRQSSRTVREPERSGNCQ
jgi:hypothetical protein